MQAAETELHRQIRAVLPTLVVLYLAATGVFAGIIIVRLTTDIPFSYFVRDPASIADERAYFGMISNVGIVIWAATAAVSLFAYLVLRRDRGDRQRAHFFLFAGLLTIILMTDDLFVIHETFKRDSGLPEFPIFALYGTLFLLFIRAYMPLLLRSEFVLLLIAGGFFGFSTLYDVGVGAWHADDLLEDGSKFFGIITWCAYLTRTALRAMPPAASAARETATAESAAPPPLPRDGRGHRRRAAARGRKVSL